MGKISIWLLVSSIIAACTCGGRTACTKKGQISFLLKIHDDTACEKVSYKGVIMFEAAKYLIEEYNNKSSNHRLELSVLDTCGSITGTLKATMKALVWSDIDCLQPPNFLGIIGPEAPTNIEAAQKLTLPLNIPHIVKTASAVPYLHNLRGDSDFLIVEGILEVVDTLKWKSFTLMSSSISRDIMKKVSTEAIARGFCVSTVNQDFSDKLPHLVYIGKPSDKVLKIQNSTILIAGNNNSNAFLSKITSNSNVLILDDLRNEFKDLENRIENSRWWTNNTEIGKYEREELRDIRWLKDAINIYAKTFEALCANGQCYGQVNPTQWNNMISITIASSNAQISLVTKNFNLSLIKNSKFVKLAKVTVQKSHTKIIWEVPSAKFSLDELNENDSNYADDKSDSARIIPLLFRNLISKEKDIKCANNVEDIKSMYEDEENISKVSFEGIDDDEWWSMVATVGGIGISMFTVGILAVYVVITNIRGTPKAKKRQIVRDTSLRRVESDRDLQVVGVRPHNNLRRENNRSIRSTMSDRSV